MNNAKTYLEEQMQNKEFAEEFFTEKFKLDLEFLIDDLIENIEAGKPKKELIKRADELKRKLEFA